MMAADSLKARAADIKDQCPWVSPQTGGIISYFRAHSLLMVGVEVVGVERRWWIVVRCAGGAHLLRQKSDAMDRVPPAFLAYYISTLLHGHFYDGEGAPLLRPHARLTSFGGYVATGGTRFIASAPVASARSQQVRPSRYPLPTTNYHLPTTNCPLPTTLYQLRAQMGGCQFTSE